MTEKITEQWLTLQQIAEILGIKKERIRQAVVSLKKQGATTTISGEPSSRKIARRDVEQIRRVLGLEQENPTTAVLPEPPKPSKPATKRGRKDKTINPNDTKSLGTSMRLARQEKGIPLTKMAELTLYTKSHLSNVENGTKKPSTRLLKAYENILEVAFTDQVQQEAKKETTIVSEPTNSMQPPALSKRDINIALDLFKRGYAYLSNFKFKQGFAQGEDLTVLEHAKACFLSSLEYATPDTYPQLWMEARFALEEINKIQNQGLDA